MTTSVQPGIAEYLTNHRNAVLATLNRDGSPQQTLIWYHFDGQTIAISTTASRLKARNVSHRPEVSLAVIDGERQLIVSGSAEVVRDLDEVRRLHTERIQVISGRKETDAELTERLQREGRVIILLKPQRFFPADL